MPIDQVQKFLGHARIQTTLRYAKVLDFDVKLSHQRYVA
jgi:site-specific recombinase XerD